MNEKNKRLKVAVIGFGVGEQHAIAYHNQPECELSFICDMADEKLRQAKTKFPQVKVTKRISDILENKDIDIVSIASFDDHHHKQVLAALKNKKHIFVEKPLCRSLKEAREIQTAYHAHQGKLKIACNHVLRAAPLYKWLKNEIEKGKFGEIYSFDGDYLYGRIEKITKGWRKDVKNYSVMDGGGIHLIDLMLWILSERPKTAFSVGNRIVTKESDFKFDDFISTTFQYPSTCVSRVSANFGCVHRHHHVMRLFGTRKTFIYDDQGPRVHDTRDPMKKACSIDLSPLPLSKGDLIPSFIKSINEDDDQTQQIQILFDGISLLSAARESLDTKQLVEVSYL